MGKYKVFYPGVYSDEEKQILAAYKAQKDALNNRGDVSVDDLVHDRLPKDTPGLGRAEVVSKKTMMSNYLQADQNNPLYFDKNYAAVGPYGDIVAFPIMVAHDGAFFDAMPYQLRDTLTISGLTHDFDILKPVYEGDTLYYITDEQTYTDITPAGGSEFRTFDITGKGRVYNQKGELVCRGRSRVKESLRILTEGSTTPKMVNQDCSDWWAMAPVHYVTDDDWDTIREYWKNEHVQGDKPLYWEDVKVGDQLVPGVDGPFQQIQVGPPMMPMPDDDGNLPDLDALPPMSPPVQEDVEYDRNDYKNLRNLMADPETFAQLVRSEVDGCYYKPEDLPKAGRKRSIIMNFHARDTAFRTISNWYGDHGQIRNVKWRIMRKTPGYDTPEYPDDPKSFVADVPIAADPNLDHWYDHQQHGLQHDWLITRGDVTRKYVQNGEHLVELQWWISRLFGRVYEEGVTIIRLPSRDDNAHIGKYAVKVTTPRGENDVTLVFNEKTGYIISVGVAPMQNLVIHGDRFSFDGNMGPGLWHFSGQFDGDAIHAEARHDELPDVSTVVGQKDDTLDVSALVEKANAGCPAEPLHKH